jgi:putative protease
MLNQARRDIVENLYNLKCAAQQNRIKTPSDKKKVAYPLTAPYLTAQVTTQEQYDACVASGIETIYYDNIIRRNQNEYTDKDGELLIGGYGGLYQYRNRNPFVTDYSFNVVNSSSVYQLHELGAKRVTLSYELNKNQIQNIVDNYYKQNDGYPSLEMIVYGKAPLLFTKYCPLKKMNQCGECKKNSYVLKDGNDTFPILSHNDCTTTILNGRNINLLDELPTIKGIQSFRLYFTTETKEEVQKIISLAQQKLQGTLVESVFNQKTDTRGYFNKEIM